MTIRRKFTADFKAQVVLQMLTEQKSAAQASREYGIKDSVLSRWKQEFIERSLMLFEQSPVNDDRAQRIAELERMVGRMAMELVTAATTMTKKAGTFTRRPQHFHQHITYRKAVIAPSSAIRENVQMPAIVINRQNLSWYCQA